MRFRSSRIRKNAGWLPVTRILANAATIVGCRIAQSDLEMKVIDRGG